MSLEPPDPSHLERLLESAGRGDAAALEELLKRYEHRVRLAARVLLRPSLRPLIDSADFVQSVHRALIPGLRDGRYALAEEGQLVALAVTVLRHKFARFARRVRALPPLEGDPPATPELPPAGELFTQILGALDGPDRRAVEMLALGHRPHEIARELGLPPAPFRARLSRLRRRLREAGYDPDAAPLAPPDS